MTLEEAIEHCVFYDESVGADREALQTIVRGVRWDEF